jgi:hypothetical protein
MRSLYVAARVFAVGAALAATVVAAAPSETRVQLAVPGRTNANVSLAARNDVIAAVWSAAAATGAADIFFAISRDGARTFSQPVRVNIEAGQVSVNGEQPPRVALIPGSGASLNVVVVWTGKGPQGTQLLTATSRDGGRSFGPTNRVPDTDAPGNRGWENVAADGNGRLHVVWLDHRALAKDGAQMAMSHHDTSHAASADSDGVAQAQQSKLYYGVLGPSAPSSTSAIASAPRSITGGVCYCCKTAITPFAANSVALAWRHVYPGNFRDIAFTISRDGGRTFAPPVRVSEDQWQLEGCPDDGPAMGVDGAGTIHLVWPTLVTGNGKEATTGIFYARSSDGRRFTPRIKVPTEGTPHHPQLAVRSNGSIALAWDELVDGTRRIAFGAGTVERDGQIAVNRQSLSGTEPGIYPALAAVPGAVVVAWTSGSADAAVINVVRQP